MTNVFSWRNSVSLCPASFCTPRPNLPVFKVSLDFLLLHSHSLWWKGHLFFFGVSSRMSCMSSQKNKDNGKTSDNKKLAEKVFNISDTWVWNTSCRQLTLILKKKKVNFFSLFYHALSLSTFWEQKQKFGQKLQRHYNCDQGSTLKVSKYKQFLPSDLFYHFSEKILKIKYPLKKNKCKETFFLGPNSLLNFCITWLTWISHCLFMFSLKYHMMA